MMAGLIMALFILSCIVSLIGSHEDRTLYIVAGLTGMAISFYAAALYIS